MVTSGVGEIQSHQQGGRDSGSGIWGQIRRPEQQIPYFTCKIEAKDRSSIKSDIYLGCTTSKRAIRRGGAHNSRKTVFWIQSRSGSADSTSNRKCTLAMIKRISVRATL